MRLGRMPGHRHTDPCVVYGQGVSHGRGLQVDVETVIEVGCDLTVYPPMAQTVGLKLDVTHT